MTANQPLASALTPRRLPGRKLGLLTLIAATYFIVAGGPYGIEDILGGAGYAGAILILLILPLFWSLPTTLMIGELTSAIPAEGHGRGWNVAAHLCQSESSRSSLCFCTGQCHSLGTGAQD